MFPTDLYTYLRTNTLIGIKAGEDRKTFTSIWMVAVGERIFARSWNKSARSWFTTLLATGVGQIKYGDTVIDVTAQKLEPQPELTGAINDRYLKKYHQPNNVKYAVGIIQPDYEKYTVEFFPAPQ